MYELKIPRFIVSNSRSDAGNFFFTLGMVQHFRARGMSVSCAVLGPNLLQACVLKRISARSVICLDTRLLSHEQIFRSLELAASGADLLIILGSRALFDSPDLGGFSDAQFSDLTRTPVVLVADADGFREGIAALLYGFYSIERNLQYIGAILSNIEDVASDFRKSLSFYERALEQVNLPAPIGASLCIEFEKQLPPLQVSQTANHISLSRNIFVESARVAAEQIDCESILHSSKYAELLKLKTGSGVASKRRARIAVSDDSCFNICFQDNLELLRFYGAELVPFSPLADQSLPENIGALYLTGACLSEYGAELSANQGMRQSIKDFFGHGGVIYAEGASSAYLSRKIALDDKSELIEGVGLLDGNSFISRPDPYYLEAEIIDESILGSNGFRLMGFNSGDWSFSENGSLPKVLRVAERGSSARPEGFSPGPQVLATFHLMHFGSCPEVAQNLVDAAEVHSGLHRRGS